VKSLALWCFLAIFAYAIDPIDLKDLSFISPDGKKTELPSRVDLAVVTIQKSSSKMVDEFLSRKDPSYLREKNAIFISSMSGVPYVVARLFALPKLRDANYPIYITFDDDLARVFLGKEGSIAVFYLDGKSVVATSFVGNTDDLASLLE